MIARFMFFYKPGVTVGLSPSDEGGASRGYLGGLVLVWFLISDMIKLD